MKSKEKKQEFEVNEKFTIKCADCDRFLLDIITLKDGKVSLTKIQVHCPCGGKSYITPVLGTHKICPVEPLTFKDVINSENKEEVYLS